MATANFTKPQKKTADDSQVKPLEIFSWTPETYPYPGGENPIIHKVCHQLENLVNHTKDIASGASFVFELMAARSIEADAGAAYLTPGQLDRLQRMAMRALTQLENVADDVASDLYDMSRGEK